MFEFKDLLHSLTEKESVGACVSAAGIGLGVIVDNGLGEVVGHGEADTDTDGDALGDGVGEFDTDELADGDGVACTEEDPPPEDCEEPLPSPPPLDSKILDTKDSRLGDGLGVGCKIICGIELGLGNFIDKGVGAGEREGTGVIEATFEGDGWLDGDTDGCDASSLISFCVTELP